MPYEIVRQKTLTNIKPYKAMDNMDNILTKDIYIKKYIVWALFILVKGFALKKVHYPDLPKRINNTIG
jgi:hypothetical protein